MPFRPGRSRLSLAAVAVSVAVRLNLARRGVNTIFTFNTHRRDGDAVVAAVEGAGANALALQLDSGNIASFDAFVESVGNAPL
jgi:hypothetical protein